MTVDFNSKSSKWLTLDKENADGREINCLTSACGYNQLINKTTHVSKESICTDLMFATGPNLTRETGVELSISEKCHHNLTYGITDFKVPLPPLYLREDWDYKNVNHIQSAASSSDWEFLFRGTYVNEKS